MIDRPQASMVLGIDPGSHESGWSLIDFTIPSAPVFFEHGNTERLDSLFDSLMQRELGRNIRLVAIEEARGRIDPRRASNILATTWIGGEAAGYARAKGFAVTRLGAHEWRLAFIGAYTREGGEADAKVKRALSMLVRHYPERSNTHERDAGGVACVAARDWRRIKGLSASYHHAREDRA